MADRQKHWTAPLSKKDLEHLLDNHFFSIESFIMARKYYQSHIHGNTEHCLPCREIAIKLRLEGT